MGSYNLLANQGGGGETYCLAEVNSRIYGCSSNYSFLLSEDELSWGPNIYIDISTYYSRIISFNNRLYQYSAYDNGATPTAYLWRLNLTGDAFDRIVTNAMGELHVTDMVVFDNTLYFIGVENPVNGRITSALYKLNANQDAWIKVVDGFFVPWNSNMSNYRPLYLSRLIVFNNRLYAGAVNGKLYRLNLAGNAWELVCNATNGHDKRINVLYVFQNRLYAAVLGINRLLRLNEAGDAWEFLCNTLYQINDMAECYGRLYVGCDGIHVQRLNLTSDHLDLMFSAEYPQDGTWSMLKYSVNDKLYVSSRRLSYLYRYNTVALNYTSDVTSGSSPLMVNYSLSVTSDYNLQSHNFDFGDGETTTDLFPSHTYIDGGSYTPVLSGTDEYNTNTFSVENYITVNAYNVTYDGNGNTGGTAPVDPTVYNQFDWFWVAPPGNLVYSGKEFKRWNTDPNGYGADYIPGESKIVDSDITLYAVWGDPSGIDSYWDVETSGTTLSAGGEGKSTSDMKLVSTYQNWDFSTLWKITEGETYPSFFKANFIADVLSGSTPLTVSFTDISEGWPDESAMIKNYDWDFGDGSPHSHDINPVHTYNSNGIYTVTLIASRNFVEDTEVKVGYINVGGEVILIADFTASPVVGFKHLTVNFTDRSIGTVETYFWNFGDGKTSEEINPVHLYKHPGIYTVSLTVTSGDSQDTKIRTKYILVNNKSTYDIAPAPSNRIFLWGDGLAYKRDIGVEIKRIAGI